MSDTELQYSTGVFLHIGQMSVKPSMKNKRKKHVHCGAVCEGFCVFRDFGATLLTFLLKDALNATAGSPSTSS